MYCTARHWVYDGGVSAILADNQVDSHTQINACVIVPALHQSQLQVLDEQGILEQPARGILSTDDITDLYRFHEFWSIGYPRNYEKF